MSDNLLNKLTQLKLPAMAGSLIRQRETPQTYDELSFEERLTLLVDDAELAARQPHIPDLSASRVGTGRELFGALREKLSGAEQGATCITF